MKKLMLLALLVCPLAFAAPKVKFETNHGNIVVELAPKVAPQTVKNFLRYVADGSYDGSPVTGSSPASWYKGAAITSSSSSCPPLTPW